MMNDESEFNEILSRIAAQINKYDTGGGLTTNCSLNVNGDPIIYGYEMTDGSSYIHRHERETISIPREAIVELIRSALISGKSEIQTIAEVEWEREREDTYVTMGEDYYDTGKKQTKITLVLDFEPKFELHWE